MVVVYVLMALVGAAAAVFAVQNIDPVVIRFLAWRIEGTPVSLVIMLSIMVGVILTSMLSIVRQWKLRSKIRQLEARVAQLQASNPPRINTAPR